MMNLYNSLSDSFGTVLNQTWCKKMALVLFVMFSVLGVNAQVATNGGSGLAPTYPSLASAVTALNAATITAPVVITLGASETAPVGGYAITASGTGSNTITLNGGGFTLTAPTPQTSGNFNDAIIKIVGGDYITIENFVMAENGANTTTAAATNNMTEWGVALLYATTTNGAQNCTIQNNTITLNRTYQNTFGIYSNSTHAAATPLTVATATTVAGGNSGLKIYGNTISNVNNGICVVGPTAAADNNDGLVIGGSALNANTISNYGSTGTFSSYANVSGSVNGILVRNTKNYTISYNSVTSSNGGTTAGTLRGIYVQAFSNAPTGTIVNNINNNTSSVISGVAIGTVNNIHVEATTVNATTTLNINSNNFNSSGYSLAASGTYAAIYHASTAGALNITNNTFTNLSINTTGTSYLVYNSCSTPTFTVSGNAVSGTFTKAGAGGTMYGYYNFGSPSGGTATISGNNFSNFVATGATTIYGIRQYTTVTQVEVISGNTVSNISGGTAAVFGISHGYGEVGGLVNGNTVTNLSAAGNVTGILLGDSSAGNGLSAYNNIVAGLSSTTASTVVGISHVAGSNTSNIYQNKIYDLSASNAGATVAGLAVSGGSTFNIHNNIIGNLTIPTGTGANIINGIGITSGTTFNIYYNTVRLAASSSTATNFGSSAIGWNGSPTTVTLRNNIFVNESVASGTGLSAAIRRSAVSLTNYGATSNNNLVFGSTLYYDGTNNETTLGGFKSRVSTREVLSVYENPPFLSTTGSATDFLHINPAIGTQVESSGAPIASYTIDFDGQTRNATLPDIGADEFTGTPVDLSGPIITYTALGNAAVGTNQTLTATIVDATGVPTSGIGLPVLYYNVNGGAFTAVTGVSIGSNQYTFTFGAAATNANDIVRYYIVAQDTVATPNLTASPASGAAGFTANPPTVTTPPTTPSQFTALGSISGTKTVCATGCDYPSLTNVGGAFADINGKVVNGNINLEIAGDLTAETGANALNAVAGAFTVKIYPTGSSRVISGSLASNALIKLNGADRITIDGSIGGTGTARNLTVTNTSTTSPTAIALVSLGTGLGATDNTIKNCNITTGAVSATAIGISVGSTAGSAGADNDNTSLLNNNISSVGKAIYAVATAAGLNNNLVITGNTINTVASGVVLGIQVGQATGALVNKNTLSIETSASTQPVAISLETGTVDTTVDSNLITKAYTSATGGYGGRGITVGTGSATSNITISNNVVAGINSASNYSAFSNSSSMGIGIGMVGTSTTITDVTGGINLYYNSVNMAGTHNYSGLTKTAALYVGTGASALNIRNNVFVNSLFNANTGTGVGAKSYSVYSDAGAAAFTTMNYNDYFVSGVQGVLAYIGSDRTDLAAIVTGFGGNVNSLNVDPGFNSATNLQPIATAVIGQGTPIAGITVDINNTTRSATAPSMGAYENVGDSTPPTITYTPLLASCSSGSRTISATITDAGSGVPMSGAGLPVLYWRINAGAYTAATATFVSGSQYDFTLGTGSVGGDTISYYVVAQDTAGSVGASPSAGAGSFTSNPPAAGIPPTTPNTYQNLGSLTGTFNVGTGQAYATLTAAISAYNSACVTGPVTFVLTDTTYSTAETFPIVINANVASSSINTLTIKPATTATITGSVAGPIVKINGADYVTIDGSNNGSASKDLTIINTSTSTTAAVVIWIAGTATDGATNNAIKNVILTGNSGTSTIAGVMVSGAALGTAAAVPNSNIVITNNTISKVQNGVFAIGNATTPDTAWTINDNTVGSTVVAEKGFRGLAVQNANGFTISGNRITGVRSAGTSTASGILVGALASNGIVSNNIIRDVKNTYSETDFDFGVTYGYGSNGMCFSSTATAANIKIFNNMVSDVASYGDFGAGISDNGYGVIVTSGAGYSFDFNTVLLNTNQNSAGLTAAFNVTVGVTAAGAISVRNNVLVNKQTVGAGARYAIYSAAPNTVFATIDYNDYFSAGANLGYIGSARATLANIIAGFGGNANSISVDPVFVSATDIHLSIAANLGLNNLGTPVAGITNDIDGDSRSATTPDMGADEFTPQTCSIADGGTATPASSSLCAPGSTTINASGYTTPLNGLTYEWERSTDLAFTTPISMGAPTGIYAALPTGSLTATTYYRLKVVCNAGTPAYSTVATVTVSTPATLTVSPAAAICNGDNTSLTVSGAVTYTWSPATGLSATTGSSVTASPAATTTYSVVGVDSNGCTTAAATVTVTVNFYPSAITVSELGSNCAGQIMTLTANGGSNASSGVVSGTGSTTTSTVGVTPFGSNYEGARTQYLVRASELTASGISAGTINSIAFNVTASGTGTFPQTNFVMKIAKTNDAAIAGGYATPNGAFTTVFSSASVPAPAIGSRIFNFSTGFIWDGTSNIIVDICHDNDATATCTSCFSGNSTVSASTTSFNSVYGSYADNAPSCGVVASNTISSFTTRPNMTFNVSSQKPIIWTPIADLYTDAAATSAYVANTPASVVYFKSSTGNPVTYTATASNGTCVSSGTVDLTPVPLPVFTVDPVTICKGLAGGTLTAVGVGNAYSWAPATGLSATTGTSVIATPTVTTTYTVTATNNTTGCQSQETVTVTVNEPVVINSISPLNPSAINGQQVVFTVSATGTGLTYQWFESADGSVWNLISGATAATLTVVANPDVNNGFQYRAEVTGAAPCGTETSEAATLTVDTTGITGQPANLTVCSLNTAQFVVTAESEDLEPEDITYGWEVSTDDGVSFIPVTDGLNNTIAGYNFSGSETNTLVLSNTNVSASGLIFHAIVNGYIFSSDAELTVRNAVVISTTVLPNQTVCATGGTATFAVAATGDDLAYQWQVSANSGSSWTDLANGAGISGATSNTLTLTNPAVGTNGNQYRVVVSGAAQCAPQTSVSGTLIINNPTITTQPVSAVTFVPNAATFTVATSAPSPTFQWQFSLNGTTGWANVADATPAGVTYTGADATSLSVTPSGLTPAGSGYYYRVIVSSDGCSTTTAAVQLTINDYCKTGLTTTGINTRGISNVVISDVTAATSVSQASGVAAPWYTLYPTPVFNVNQGHNASVAITLSTNTPVAAHHSAAWIDYNANGIFEANENVALSTTTTTSSAAGVVVTYNFQVPLGAQTGNTRMRIRAGHSSAYTAAGACTGTTNGETEDYIVNILPATPCSGTPTASTASASATTFCISGSATLTATGFSTTVSGISLQWYNSAGIIAGATNTTYVTPVLTANETYYVRTICANGGGFADSAPVAITVNNPQILSTTPGSRCGVGTVNLSATASAGATMSWYAVQTGGTALATGATFTTPSISSTTNYYVEAAVGDTQITVGPASPTAQGGTIATQTVAWNINFTVLSATTLKSVVVYPLTSGQAGVITVRNGSSTSGVVVKTINYSTNVGGGAMPQVITIDAPLTAGSYNIYTDTLPTAGLSRNNSGAVYPYTSAVANITGNGYDNTYFMGVYDWKFGAGCSSARTLVAATVASPPNLTLSSNTASTCSGSATAPVTVTSTVTDFDSYVWSPSEGVSGNATSGFTFNPIATTTYTLTATNTISGCVNVASVAVTVNPLPSALAITPVSSAICADGSAVLLTASGGTSPKTAAIGTATTTTSTAGVTPFNSNWEGSRVQYIVRASELTAAGFTAGNIKSLAFNVTTRGAGTRPQANFAIKVAHTADLAFAGAYAAPTGSFTTVYSAASEPAPAVGSKVYTFATSFAWDGISNVLIDICHDNDVNNTCASCFSSSSTVSANTTLFNSVYGRYNDNAAACGVTPTTAASSFTTRPLMTFSVDQQNAVTWTPQSGLFTDAGATAAYTGGATPTIYAKPTSTQVYTATATLPITGCNVTSTATVTVNPTPTAVAPSTMDLCAGVLTTPVALVGTPSGVTFNISGGAAVGLANQTGVTSIPAFTSVPGTATVTVTPTADGCTGTAVTFLIKVSPATVGGTVTGGTTVCGGNASGILTLSGHTGNVVRWESSVSPFSVWSPIVNTATTYTSGSLTQTTQFRAVLQSGTCQEVASAPTTVTVNAVTLGAVSASAVCANTDAVVTLSGMAPNSTSTVAYTRTGVVQTPVTVVANASGVGTFSVMVTGAGQNVVVTSITRTDVTPNCAFIPSSGNSVSFVLSTQCTQVQTCGITLPSIDSPILANIVANVQGYRWRVTTTSGTTAGQVQTLDTSIRQMKLTQLASYGFATQYKVEVATLRSGVWGPFNVGCTISTPAAATSLVNCNQSVASLSDAVYATLVPFAPGYRFRITDPINGANTQVLERSVRDFRMTMITSFVVQYGKAYNVEVAVRNTDGNYMAYSGICQVTTPVFPTTSLQDSQCEDYAVPSNSSAIYAFSYPGAVGYVFQLTGPGLPPTGAEVVKGTRSFTLNDFAGSGLVSGATYNVKVRLIFNIADPAGPYGKTCTIVAPAASKQDVPAAQFNAVAFPNPFAESFNIDVTTSLSQNIGVKVYDMTGRLLETREAKVGDIGTLQVGDRYPSGVYNVVVTQGEHVRALRVIKR